ncbi:hypothetical protein QVD17_35973 [Tagetes erecta]|uniref:BED-type domain-containing protein n=1 Tax=Tagetes erecta TaxID=13708 RepID=A0AAD8JRS9_TARER|nr:hypothetical protein QVD17_35973 [Tagetes erecta]
MASDLEPVAVNSQKHDPAWKHCQMYKSGDKVQLKCIYCGKMFKGGGIHRIKEHLAGQKGNASSCLRVQPDVRLLMQESLNGVVVKKRKKQKLAEDITSFNAGEAESFGNQCELTTDVVMVPVPEPIHSGPGLLVNQEDVGTGSNKRGGGRRKKGFRVRKGSNALVVSDSVYDDTKRVNHQVSLAVGRFLLDAGVSLDAVNSVYFQPMIDAIASQGSGVVGPSYHDLRSWILKNMVQEVRSDVDQFMGSWGKSGCSVLADEWESENGVYRVKEAIKKELVDKKDYMVYWNIIDRRWEQLQRHPLHTAGFYLNPKFFYSTEGDIHLKIRSSVYDCVERLIPDPTIQDKIVKETTLYREAAGDFGRKIAIRGRDTLFPAEWWSTYGGACPNLVRLAVRILSQTCSLVGSKLNKISFQHIHESKNYVERQRLSDMVFVQYNMRLKEMFYNKEHENLDPISYDNIRSVEAWVTEKEIHSNEIDRSDWMTVDPPIGNVVILGPEVDDIEALGEGFDDHEIFDGLKDSGEENCESNVQQTGC